jgi:hypothetical protein
MSGTVLMDASTEDSKFSKFGARDARAVLRAGVGSVVVDWREACTARATKTPNCTRAIVARIRRLPSSAVNRDWGDWGWLGKGQDWARWRRRGVVLKLIIGHGECRSEEVVEVGRQFSSVGDDEVVLRFCCFYREWSSVRSFGEFSE